MKRIKIFKNEVKLLKLLDDEELDIFTYSFLNRKYGKMLYPLQFTLESLVDRGLILRLEKGKYCRHNFRNEFVISNYLVDDGVVAYWSALNFHVLTEQFPNTIFVQTTKQKKHKTVFGVRYHFIKVKPQKLIGFEMQGYGNHQFRITDVEKTIVDCFDLLAYSGGFAELIRAFAQAQLQANKMIRYCQAIDNLSAIKRMAYLAEVLEKNDLEDFLAFAKSRLKEKYTLFDAFGSNEGDYISKWRLRMNLSLDKILGIVYTEY